MNSSDTLMLNGVVAFCVDCRAETIFMPVDCDCTTGPSADAGDPGCEFCCTACDAAVFLLEVLDNTGTPHARVA